MKRRILAMLCVLSLMLGMLNTVAFAADADTAARIGTQSYSSLQAAVDAFDSGVITLEADAQDITVAQDVYLDLNGYDIDNVTVTGGTLYCMDSQTDDYTVADGVYGKLTGTVTGNVAGVPVETDCAEDGYLMVTTDEGTSFHRVKLQVYAMSLRAGNVGVYYKSHFIGDEVVAGNVQTFGVALSVVGAPTAENMQTQCGYSWFTDFKAGEGSNAESSTGTLLHGIMKTGNTDQTNTRNAGMPVYGRPYIKTADGLMFGAVVSRSLQEQIEAVDNVWDSLLASQKAPVVQMYQSYKAAMDSWDIPNIKGAEDTGADTEDSVITLPIPVTAENGVVTESVTVSANGVTVTVPAGVKLADGASTLTVVVTPKETSDAGLTLEESQVLIPMDVHVDGISADNTVPLTIHLGKIMPENLNMGNYTIYHVENGMANEMVLIAQDAEFTAHNQYKYTLDGEVTLHMATFSEVAAVANEENAWNGGVNTAWYSKDAESYEIRNADQLAGFGQIVGGMAEGIDRDSFEGKTVTLLSDINLGDAEEANTSKIFYPIGYYNVKNDSGVITESSVMSFRGTFDGNGNTISNFYQNTWEMDGDYNYSDANENYYKDAMGLFGYVVGGAVKNLTVDNFSSDGEFTPTGVIAAFAANATFENIAITNCNPRVYNTGNGGIVGIGGNSTDVSTEGDENYAKLTLKNITVDNSNTISALWGTYDCSAGGLLGMFRGKGLVEFVDCHVSATMDVYNDVCGNYQYYWYRYCGMLIGSVRTNTTSGGYTVADTTGITATGCTVSYGDWNEYWYCELVANSIASYTHDHQFSRLTPISDISEIYQDGNWTKTGNFVIITKDANGNVTDSVCYHIVKDANGNLTQHTHEDAGYETTDVDGDGIIDSDLLKEDRQRYYIPFNQLLTGYGWGVKADLTYTGVEVLEGGALVSTEKFDVVEGFDTEIVIGTELDITEIFTPKANANVSTGTVHAYLSPVGEDSTVVPASCVIDNGYMEGHTLTFNGEGAAKITITDYWYCTPTTVYVTVGEPTAVEKFTANAIETKITGESVTIGDLFTVIDNASIDAANVTVTVGEETVVTGAEWATASYTFNAAGEYVFTITDNNYCIPAIVTVTVEDPQPVDKFEVKATTAYAAQPVKLGDLFAAKDGASIVDAEVVVTGGTYTANTSDWTQGTIVFENVGSYTVTITDNNLCNTASSTVTVSLLDAFEIILPNYKTYLYRVGNLDAFNINKLFAINNADSYNLGDITVTAVSKLSGETLMTVTTTEAAFGSATMQFANTFTGPVVVTIESSYANPVTLNLEVVTAKNAVSAASATSNNVVLLDDIGFSSITVSGGYTLYGNGFTLTCTSDSVASDRNYGFVSLTNGTLDNVQIKVPNYSYAVLYDSNKKDSGNKSETDSSGKTRYYNVKSAVLAEGNSQILNSYISGGRAAVYLLNGDLLIDNSTIEGGAAANIHLEAAQGLTLRDTTLIQEPKQATVHDTSKKLMGLSVIAMCDGNGLSTPITLEGTLCQYAWACEDYKQYVPSDGQSLVSVVLKETDYLHEITYADGVTRDSLNLGFLFMPSGSTAAKEPVANGLVIDERTDSAQKPYGSVDINGSAYVYSYKKANGTSADVATKPSYVSSEQAPARPAVLFNDANENRIYETAYDETRGWTSTLTVDVDAGDYTFTFDKLLAEKFGQNLNYTVQKADGTAVDKTAAIVLNDSSTTEFVLTITDDQIYNENGDKCDTSVEHTYTFMLLASKTSIPAPEWADTTLTGMPYIVVDSKGGDWNCAVPVLDGLKVKYRSKTQNEEVTLSLGDITFANAGLQNGTNNTLTITADNEYTLTITTSGFKTNDNGKPVVVGGKLYFTVSSSGNYVSTSTTSRTVTINYTFQDANNTEELTLTKTFTVNYSEHSGTQYKYSDFCNGTLTEASCVAAGTLITLADGTQVPVEELTGTEQLLVWNLETGAYDSAPIVFVDSDAQTEYEIVHLYFSDGTDVEVIAEHGFFDTTLGEYVYLDRNNAADYIGHSFVKQGDIAEGTWGTVELTDVVIENKVTTAYSPVTFSHLCYYVDGMLSMPGGIEGLFNIFQVDVDTMAYDAEKMAQDIETYGLFTYEDFADMIPEEAFYAFNGAYLKVAIGKGMLTWEDIEYLAQRYVPLM